MTLLPVNRWIYQYRHFFNGNYYDELVDICNRENIIEIMVLKYGVKFSDLQS